MQMLSYIKLALEQKFLRLPSLTLPVLNVDFSGRDYTIVCSNMVLNLYELSK